MEKPDKTKIRKSISETETLSEYSVFCRGFYSWNEFLDKINNFCIKNKINIEDITVELDGCDEYPEVNIHGNKKLDEKEIKQIVEEIYNEKLEDYKKWNIRQEKNKIKKEKKEKELYEKLKEKYGDE